MLKNLRSEYSDEEIELIKHFECKELAIFLTVTAVYQSMVNRAFSDGVENKHTKALRVAYKAFNKNKPVRLTEEFNSLIRKELK